MMTQSSAVSLVDVLGVGGVSLSVADEGAELQQTQQSSKGKGLG